MASTIVIIVLSVLLAVSIMFNIYLIAKNALIREYVQSYDESIKQLEDKLRALIQKSKVANSTENVFKCD